MSFVQLRMSFVQWLMCGVAASLCGYVVVCWRQKRAPALQHVIESGVWGGTVVAGLHLMLCMLINPAAIVEVTDADGRHYNEPVVVEMNELHRVHVFGCGAGTAYLGIAAIVAACRSHARESGDKA